MTGSADDVRLVVSDMDGTLLTEDGAVPDGFWPLLDTMRRRGITFVPASGRQYATLARLFERAPDGVSFIAENGNLVVHEGSVLAATRMERSLVASVIERTRGASAFDLGLVACGRRSAYIERADSPFVAEVATYYAELEQVPDLTAIDDEMLKLAIFDFGPASASAAVYAPFAETHQVVVSSPHWIDIMDPGVHKGRAVQQLQWVLGVTPAQTVVFGDYLNDLEMLDAAEHSYAVDNAHPELHGRARFQAPSNRDHGVVQTLARLLA